MLILRTYYLIDYRTGKIHPSNLLEHYLALRSVDLFLRVTPGWMGNSSLEEASDSVSSERDADSVAGVCVSAESAVASVPPQGEVVAAAGSSFGASLSTTFTLWITLCKNDFFVSIFFRVSLWRI